MRLFLLKHFSLLIMIVIKNRNIVIKKRSTSKRILELWSNSSQIDSATGARRTRRDDSFVFIYKIGRGKVEKLMEIIRGNIFWFHSYTHMRLRRFLLTEAKATQLSRMNRSTFFFDMLEKSRLVRRVGRCDATGTITRAI